MTDRLQDSFESKPLTAHRPMPPAPMVTPIRKRMWKFGIVMAGVAFATMLFVLTYLAVDGVWWNVESQAVCTVTSKSSHPVYSKSGFLGTDWDLATSCGALQVTRNGERFPDSAAQHLARSLEVGASYRFYLRGWDGWPQGARGIIAATRQ
ncbi:hypothetical protein ACFVUP_38990 [Streptomyces bacillaris]|uniref:hypothetical protein n=1 Tax=Streptomyces bacillaris TaxID=68179 RepID=UPI0036DEE430